MAYPLGELVRKQRIKAGMTQLELAKKLGYTSTQFVSLFERGYSKIPAETIGKIIMVLPISETKVVNMLVNEFRKNLLAEITKGKKEVLNVQHSEA